MAGRSGDPLRPFHAPSGRRFARSPRLGLLLACVLSLSDALPVAWADGDGAPPPAPANLPPPVIRRGKRAPPPAPLAAPVPAPLPVPVPGPVPTPLPSPGPAPVPTPLPRPVPQEARREVPALPIAPEEPPPAAPPSPAPQAASAPVIRRITFVGNDLFSSESLKTLMGLKEGQRLTDAGLDSDMALLARYFERARVVKSDAPGGAVDLLFEVEENPLVVDVRVYGAAEIDEAEVLKQLSTKIGHPLFQHQLAADAQTLVASYRRKGYAFVHVPEPAISKPPGGGRRVDFTIVEGPLVSVDRIVLRGNQSIRRGELLELMQTKQRGFWDFLNPTPFREDTLREDVVALTQLYQDEGFLDAEVALEDVRFSDDKERAHITIAIQEHEPYVLGEVRIVIERPEDGREGSMTPEDRAYLTEERLRELLAVTSGQRWSGKLADWGRERIREQIYRRSYLDARVGEPVLRGREGELVADLELRVVLGWKYRLRRLDFVGNEFTRDSFLRREVRVTPGGFIDRNELERGEARLKRTRYFDRSSLEIVDAPRAGGREDDAWKDARYEIVEAKTGRLGFSVGLSTSGGLFGSISFQKRNFDIARLPRSWDDLWSGRAFTGNGQTFDAVIAPGTENTTFGAGFTEPNLFGSDWQLTLRGYRRLEYRNDYRADRLGYQVGVSRSLFRRRDDTLQVLAGVRWRQEQIEVYDLALDATPGATLFEGYNVVNALRGYLTVKASDDLRRARSSFEAGVGLELLGTSLGGDIDALLFDVSATQSWVLGVDDEGRRRRLTLRGQLGWSQAQEDTPEVPPFERFFLGGNDFRGFARRGVGPHINGYPTGGEWMLGGSIEYQHPLFSDVISGVLFMDIGTLGTSIDADDAWRPRLSVGPGLRVKIPMFGEAPLALDFGFVLLDEDEDERQLFTFSVSRDF